MALGIPSLHLWTLTSWVGFISKGFDGPLQLWTSTSHWLVTSQEDLSLSGPAWVMCLPLNQSL